MATTPMMPMSAGAGMQSPDSPMMDNAPADNTGEGVTVCITALPDGSFSVGPLEGDMQPAPDMKAALTAAMSLLRGEAPEEAGAMQGQFDAGFTGGKPAATAPGMM